MDREGTTYQSQGLDRALHILRVLGASDSVMGLAELTKRVDLPKPTIARLLHVLVAQDFVARDGNPSVYSVGHAVLEIAEGYRRQVGLVDIVSPYLRKLADETRLTANLATLEGPWVLHACVEEPDRPLRFRSSTGTLDFPHCTSLGKMLLAQLEPHERDAHLPAEPYAASTPKTKTTRVELDAELADIADRGFAVDDEERDLGVVCVAVPLRTGLERPLALSVAGPAGELNGENRERLLGVLHATADVMSKDPRFLAAARSEYS